MTSLTFKTKYINHKALIAIEVITERTTRCYFKDIFSGREFNHILAVSFNEIQRWINGENIQKAMPNLSKDVRELFVTGLTDKEFETLFQSL